MERGRPPHPSPPHEPGNIEHRTSNESKEPSPHPDPLPSHPMGAERGKHAGSIHIWKGVWHRQVQGFNARPIWEVEALSMNREQRTSKQSQAPHPGPPRLAGRGRSPYWVHCNKRKKSGDGTKKRRMGHVGGWLNARKAEPFCQGRFRDSKTQKGQLAGRCLAARVRFKAPAYLTWLKGLPPRCMFARMASRYRSPHPSSWSWRSKSATSRATDRST